MTDEQEVYIILEQAMPLRMRAILATDDLGAEMAALSYLENESMAKSVGIYDSYGFLRSIRRQH